MRKIPITLPPMASTENVADGESSEYSRHNHIEMSVRGFDMNNLIGFFFDIFVSYSYGEMRNQNKKCSGKINKRKHRFIGRSGNVN